VPAVELSVHPDDLAAGAAALRRTHAALRQASAEFAATALRLVPQLGAAAAASAQGGVTGAHEGTGMVADNIATFAQGLTAAAGYYAALDFQALGTVPVEARSRPR
jgi:hypothetical protein